MPAKKKTPAKKSAKATHPKKASRTMTDEMEIEVEIEANEANEEIDEMHTELGRIKREQSRQAIADAREETGDPTPVPGSRD